MDGCLSYSITLFRTLIWYPNSTLGVVRIFFSSQKLLIFPGKSILPLRSPSWNIRNRKTETRLGPVQSSTGSNGRFWQFTTYRVQAEPFCPSQKLGQELNLLALSLALLLWLLSAYENIFQSSPIKALQTFYPAEELILNVWAKLWSFLKNCSINFS